ncbi:hypothetical protein KR093_006048 [Drosophila rubida]|uniref:Uncharacterized protein n=1 Tax=Drosophila rubida TaxID=30044 RepID=A0AAD4KD66_9MUSC|nr:hypothetical protein KR093_006048 [Drosophila rubida]
MKCLTLRDDSVSTEAKSHQAIDQDLLFFDDQQVEELSKRNVSQVATQTSQIDLRDPVVVAAQANKPPSSLSIASEQENDPNDMQKALEAAKLEKYRILDAIVEQQVKKLSKSLYKAKKPEPIKTEELYVNQRFVQSSETDLEEPVASSSTASTKKTPRQYAEVRSSEYRRKKDSKTEVTSEQPQNSQTSIQPTHSRCDPKSEERLTKVVQMYADLAFTDQSDDEATARGANQQQAGGQVPRFSNPESMEQYIETIMKVYQPTVSDAPKEPSQSVGVSALPKPDNRSASQRQREDLIAFSKVGSSRSDEVNEVNELKRSSPKIIDVTEHNVFAKRSRKSEIAEMSPINVIKCEPLYKSLEKLKHKQASTSKEKRYHCLHRRDSSQFPVPHVPPKISADENVEESSFVPSLPTTPEKQPIQCNSNRGSPTSSEGAEVIFYDPDGEPVHLQLAILDNPELDSE